MNEGVRAGMSRAPYVARRPVKIVDRSRLVKAQPAAKPPLSAKPQFTADIRPVQGKPVSNPHVTMSQKPQAHAAVPIVQPQPFVSPARPKQEPSKVLRRQFAQPTPPAKPTKLAKVRMTKIQAVLVVLAFVVFGLGLLVNVQTIQTNHSAKAQVAALSKSAADDSGSKPTEAKPSGGAYAVAPNLPKYLKIPKLNVNARVVSLGVTTDNQLKAPTNIYDAGWYNASAHPGDSGSNGAILIDGHVHGPTLPGVFVGLNKLGAGDTIQIIRGDNAVFQYTVVKTQNYDANTLDMSLGLTSIKPGQPGLNLITCGGKYNRSAGEYEQRTMVFAVQQS